MRRNFNDVIKGVNSLLELFLFQKGSASTIERWYTGRICFDCLVKCRLLLRYTFPAGGESVLYGKVLR